MTVELNWAVNWILLRILVILYISIVTGMHIQFTSQYAMNSIFSPRLAYYRIVSYRIVKSFV